MSVRTPEQIAADFDAEAAIRKLLKAYNRESAQQGATPLSYVIMVESVLVDDDGTICDEFHDLLTNPGERLTVAEGLLTRGMKTIVKDSD